MGIINGEGLIVLVGLNRHFIERLVVFGEIVSVVIYVKRM